jgi:peptidoglycan hydrolase CwlO-like protein
MLMHIQPNNLIAQLRQFKASKAELRTNSAQHEKDVKSMAENRKALEAKKVALEKEENALVLREAALKKHETELSDKQKRSQQEAKRLREYMPQEVREWLDFVVEDEPETKRQKTG